MAAVRRGVFRRTCRMLPFFCHVRLGRHGVAGILVGPWTGRRICRVSRRARRRSQQFGHATGGVRYAEAGRREGCGCERWHDRDDVGAGGQRRYADLPGARRAHPWPAEAQAGRRQRRLRDRRGGRGRAEGMGGVRGEAEGGPADDPGPDGQEQALRARGVPRLLVDELERAHQGRGPESIVPAPAVRCRRAVRVAVARRPCRRVPLGHARGRRRGGVPAGRRALRPRRLSERSARAHIDLSAPGRRGKRGVVPLGRPLAPRVDVEQPGHVRVDRRHVAPRVQHHDGTARHASRCNRRRHHVRVRVRWQRRRRHRVGEQGLGSRADDDARVGAAGREVHPAGRHAAREEIPPVADLELRIHQDSDGRPRGPRHARLLGPVGRSGNVLGAPHDERRPEEHVPGRGWRLGSGRERAADRVRGERVLPRPPRGAFGAVPEDGRARALGRAPRQVQARPHFVRGRRGVA